MIWAAKLSLTQLVKAATSCMWYRFAVVGSLDHRRDGLQSTENRFKVDLKKKKKATKIPEMWPHGELLFIVIERAWRGGRVGHLIMTASAQVDLWGHLRNRAKWDNICPCQDEEGSL